MNIVFMRYAKAAVHSQSKNENAKPIHVVGYSLASGDARKLRDALDEAITKVGG